MVAIPAELAKKLGIKPGCQLEWRLPEEGSDEIRLRLISSRGELARRLMGSARTWSPDRDAVQELIQERAREDPEEGLA